MDYQKMYSTAFNGITDALKQLESIRQQTDDTISMLKILQQETEEMFVGVEDIKGEDGQN